MAITASTNNPAVDRVDLRHLAGDLRVVHRIKRVLVLHLRDQQLEKTVLRVHGLLAGRLFRGVGGGTGRLDGADDVHGGPLSGEAQDWPSCRVLSSRLLAVLITSMLFW